MNFKQLCESILEEADGRGIQIASVALGRDESGALYLTNPTHRNVVKWTQEEYRRLQLLEPNWEFHHKRGKFLTTAASKESYKKAGIRRVNKDSLYFIKSGETARTPIYTQTYDWWVYQQQIGNTTSSSVPTTIVQGPEDEWLLWQIPSAAGAVYGEWWVKPHELVNADDEPCWDAHYHDVIKWNVLNLYAVEFAGEKSAPKLQARVRLMLPALMSAFEGDYLPSVYGPCTFM